MSKLSDVIERDEQFAKLEAARGLHHTIYLRLAITRMLRDVGIKCEGGVHSYGAGTWWIITDPATGLEYEINLSPRDFKGNVA